MPNQLFLKFFLVFNFFALSSFAMVDSKKNEREFSSRGSSPTPVAVNLYSSPPYYPPSVPSSPHNIHFNTHNWATSNSDQHSPVSNTHQIESTSKSKTYFQSAKQGMINKIYWTLKKTMYLGITALGVFMLAETGALTRMADMATDVAKNASFPSTLEEFIPQLPINTLVGVGLTSLGLVGVF